MNRQTYEAVDAGASREAFMAGIRSALGRARTKVPSQALPDVDESIVRLAGAEDDLVGMFEQRAQEVGMVVHRLRQDQRIDKIKALLDEHGARRVVVNVGEGVERGKRGSGRNRSLGELGQHLADAGYKLIEIGGREGLDRQFDADAGITDVQAALSETGTMICTSSSMHSRGPSLVPQLHIAIVRHHDILPDMIDYWQRLKGLAHTDLPSSISFITGPSKTADIENILITGVHGPKHVHILIVEEGA